MQITSSSSDYLASSSSDSEEVLSSSEEAPVRRACKRRFADIQERHCPKRQKRADGCNDRLIEWEPKRWKILTANGADKPIEGRDEKVHHILRMLQQEKSGSRPLLIGSVGVGKKTIVRKLALMLKEESIPENLKGRSIVMINCKELLGTQLDYGRKSGPGQHLSQIIRMQLARERHPIFYLRDIDDIFDVEYATEYLLSLFRTQLLFIASISGGPGQEGVKSNCGILSDYRFEPIEIKECSQQEAALIIKENLKKYPLAGSYIASEETIRLTVHLTAQHILNKPLPMKAVNILHQAAYEKNV